MINLKRIYPMLCSAIAVIALGACSDFDDYNTASTEGQTATATQTLWENISGNAQLSNFASLVRKAGFDDELNTTHYYTVWAPLDGTYDAAALQALDSKSLLNRFVKNHIADFGHGASGSVQEHVFMLNEKSYDFVGTGSYTFDNIRVEQANLPNSNGLLHTLNGQAAYYPNLYEFITDSLQSGGKDIDSLRNYFMKAHVVELDKQKSVPGSIVDGLQTYVDSVMTIKNDLWTALNAKLAVEDSAYTFLMPTNRAWNSLYKKVESYYSYPSTIASQLFSGNTVSTVSETLDGSYLQDSIAMSFITRYLLYSNNDAYNKWLVGNPTTYGTDTLRTTLGKKLSNPADIIGQTIEELKMSNGMARIVDSIAVLPEETFAPELFYAATNSGYRARVALGTESVVTVDSVDATKVDLSEQRNPDQYRYLLVEASGYNRPDLTLYMPDVLSTTYDIYCIFVPQNVDLTKPDAVTLPNRVIFTMNYCDENGKLSEKVFLDESEENISSFMERFPNVRDIATNRTTIRAFSNDVSKVDTLYIGEFTFPACYYHMNSGDKHYRPNIKISSPFSPFYTNVLAAYSRELRIAGILLKPKGEVVEPENSNNE